MKKISCVGYHATGSGAVDDYLREFDNVESANYGIESRFLQDPDGISDLEYNLIENPHRLNSGFALKRYLKFVKNEERTYKHIFGSKWKELSYNYINELSNFSYYGYWHGDIWLLNPVTLFIYKTKRFINKLLPKKIRKNKYYNYFKNIKTYSVDINQDVFLDKTRKYCENLCNLLNKNNKEYVIIDQAISPQNPDRYLRYIDDLKVIIVDRDPRDVYLNDIVKNKDFVLPKDINEFCKVYKASRKQIESTNKNVMRINFEDMIYNYDEITKKINNFIGLNEKNHKYKKKYFNPDISKMNTKMWEKNMNYKNEMKIIEKELSNYLYKNY